MIVLPVYKIAVLPRAAAYIRADAFAENAGRPAQAGEKVILLPAKDNTARGALTDESFQSLAVTGVVREGVVNGFVGIQTLDRVGVDDISVTNGRISLSVSPRPEIQDLSEEEEKAKFSELKDAILSFSSQYEWGGMTRQILAFSDNLGGLIAVLSPFMQMTAEDQYALLREDSLKKRAEMIEKTIYESLESARLYGEGQEKQASENQKLYRESAIKKQISYLQNELDEMHPENVSEIRKLEHAVDESGMNEAAEKEVRKILQRMKNEGEQTQEYGMLYDYVDFLTKLPWKKSPFKRIDLDAAREILDADHYGLKKIKERIIQQIAVLDLRKTQSGSILCFVGAPGTGKTSIGRSIKPRHGARRDRQVIHVLSGRPGSSAPGGPGPGTE
ncbi:MAG: hypothetical protein J6I56_08025 [Lachnospiraceae bacterium]|nr:hypothetical protein [Lachnospiraceae bacterium]